VKPLKGLSRLQESDPAGLSEFSSLSPYGGVSITNLLLYISPVKEF